MNVIFRLRGTVVPRIALRMGLVGAVAAMGSVGRAYLGVDLSIPDRAHAIVGVALGLLLVFRTNASYDRFWEGRKLVGALVNACRDLARQSSSYLDGAARVRAGQLVTALYATVRRYLRGERDYPELASVLSDAERVRLAEVRATPLYLAQLFSNLMSDEVRAGRLPEERLQAMDANLTKAIEAWGGAERIVRTPIPLAYAHHIKVFLVVFCLSLPLALLPTGIWFSVVGSGVVAFGFFGIDEIGVEIEDPFGYDPNDLPLDAIGERLGADVTQITTEPGAGK
ncbi:MAG: bestrophin family protein [Polyangiaceae bacterium]|nr:bestrophin family protein [Polyangiaceae bacterium]